MDHIVLKPSGYSFRFILPKPLQHRLRRRELRLTLRTRSRREARHRAQLVYSVLVPLLRRLEPLAMLLTEDLIVRLIADYTRRARELIDQAHLDGSHADKEAIEGLELHLTSRLEELSEGIETGRVPPTVHRDAEALLVEGGFEAETASSAYQRFCYDLMHAQFGIDRHYLEVCANGAPPLVDYLALTRVPLGDAQSVPSRSPQGRLEAAAHAPLMSECIDDFLRQRSDGKEIRANTRSDYNDTFVELLFICGNLPVTAYKRSDIERFRTVFMKLPKHRRKNPETASLRLDQLLAIEVPQSKRRADSTASEAMRRVSQLFKWAVNANLIVENPSRGLTVKVRVKTQREVFSDADLKEIFGSPGFTEGFPKTYLYWLPILALYTGARISELAQLHLDDVSHEDGVHLLNVIGNPERDQHVKGPNSRRRIPVHSKLVALGFLDYTSFLKNKGDERLFPDLRKGNRSWWQTPSKRFGSLLEGLGLKAKSKVFHSFRHTVVTRLFERGLTSAQVHAITGHKKNDVGESAPYLHDLRPQPLQEIIERLNFDVSLDHLKGAWQFSLPKKYRPKQTKQIRPAL